MTVLAEMPESYSPCSTLAQTACDLAAATLSGPWASYRTSLSPSPSTYRNSNYQVIAELSGKNEIA